MYIPYSEGDNHPADPEQNWDEDWELSKGEKDE